MLEIEPETDAERLWVVLGHGSKYHYRAVPKLLEAVNFLLERVAQLEIRIRELEGGKEAE